MLWMWQHRVVCEGVWCWILVANSLDTFHVFKRTHATQRLFLNELIVRFIIQNHFPQHRSVDKDTTVFHSWGALCQHNTQHNMLDTPSHTHTQQPPHIHTTTTTCPCGWWRAGWTTHCSSRSGSKYTARLSLLSASQSGFAKAQNTTWAYWNLIHEGMRTRRKGKGKGRR